MVDFANDYGRVILGLLCLAITLVLFRSKAPAADWFVLWLGVAALVRIAGAILAHASIDWVPRGDAVLFYLPWGQAVLDGAIPYRELATPFSPGFPMLLAGLLALWANPLVFIVFFLLCDLAATALWLAIGRRSGVAVRHLGPVLALNPATVMLAVLGQDEALVLLLAALLAMALQRERWRLGALWTVLGFLCTKVLFVLYALPWGRAWLRWPTALILAVPTLGVAAVLLLAGADPLLPLRAGEVEGLTFTYGNLFYIATAFGPSMHQWTAVFDGLLLASLVGAALFYLRHPPSAATVFVDLAMPILLWSLLARMSWYEVLALPALAIILLQGKPTRMAAVLVVGFATLIVQMPRLWWRMVDFGDVGVGEGEMAGATLAFLAIQIVFVAGKLALLFWLFRLRRRLKAAS